MKDQDYPSNMSICIVGSHILHNELLASFLSRQFGTECSFEKEINRAMSHDDSNGGGHVNLILLDCLDRMLPDLLTDLKKLKLNNCHTRVALFNIFQNQNFERECLKKGVKGFFYRNDSTDNLVSGIKHLLNGKIWVARKVMAECIIEESVKTHLGRTNLTPRQIEILHLLLAGASNKEISHTLSISKHTVKAHLYVLFQLIDVANRSQAAAWAARYLSV